MSKIGTWFEERISKALREMQETHGLFYHRIKDSKTAGKVRSNSPSDFLVAYDAPAQLWEAKASEIHPSLRTCLSSMVRDSQVGYHQLWNMNGGRSYFLFFSDVTGWVEVWDSTLVLEARISGRPLPRKSTTGFQEGAMNPALLELFGGVEGV